MGDAEFDVMEDEIKAYIATATSQFEYRTQRKVGKQTLLGYYNDFCSAIKTGPIISIEEIQYKDCDGVWQVLDSLEYEYLAGDTPTIKAVNTWPAISTDENAVKITFIAGFETVPDTIAAWVKLAVKHLIDGCGEEAGIPRNFCQGIIDQYRLYV